jgi:type II restriction enzyme
MMVEIFLSKNPAKKGRAIAETDTDGTFGITTREVEESEKIKKN